MDLNQAAALLQASPDYRLLRRVPKVARWSLPRASNDVRRAVFVDT